MRKFLLFFSLAVGLLGCHKLQSGNGDARVRIAIHRDAIAFLPLRISQTFGYYRQEGLNVEMSDVAGGSKAIEALLGGSVDVAVSSVSDAVLLASQGRHVRCFFILYTRPLIAVAVAPTMKERIRTIRDLKGHTIGVSAPGSASHQFLDFLLVSNNISPENVNIVSVGMSASSVAALEHGKVDAAVLLASAITNFEDRNPGNLLLVDTRTPDGAKAIFGSEVFPSLALMAQDDWLQQNPDVARRLGRSVRKGLGWMRENPVEKIREALPEGATMASPESDFRAIRDTQKVVSVDGMMPDGAPEMIVKFVTVSNEQVRAAHVDASEIYTNQFVAER